MFYICQEYIIEVINLVHTSQFKLNHLNCLENTFYTHPLVDFFSRPKPVILVIADGIGVAPPGPGNAVTLAKTPFLDKYWSKFPHTHLKAAELDAGLPKGDDGTCRSGHKNIGAGRIIFENLPRINKSINDKSFFANPMLKRAIKHSEDNESNIHVIGLIGGGKKHSSINHFLAVNKFFADHDLDPDKLLYHIITDGVDSKEESAAEYIQQLEINIDNNEVGKIASIIGRDYVIGEKANWDNIQIAYKMMTQHKALESKSWQEVLVNSYKNKYSDRNIKPNIILDNGTPPPKISDNDVVIFLNYEADGATKLTKVFMDELFMEFERLLLDNLLFIGMTQYDRGIPEHQLFPPITVHDTLGKTISDNHLRQLRIASSLRMKHVTSYLNNMHQGQYPGEDRIEIPKIDENIKPEDQPEMSAPLITDLVLQKIDEEEYDFIVVNLHNTDIVAHTGILDASITAVEETDKCIGRIVSKTLDKNGVVIVTSDHGNAEELVNDKGGLDTKHSINPVPFLVIKDGENPKELLVGTLADIAPTILTIMGIEIPTEMTGRNLLT